MIARQEIIACINTAFDAVNQSKVGPIFRKDEAGQEVFNTLAMNTYYYVVQKIVPGSVDMTAVMFADDDLKDAMAKDDRVNGKKATNLGGRAKVN